MERKIKHVAIIMDGNGRWAQGRSHSRFFGHVRGSSVVGDIVEEADDMGLSALTLYAFSTENWSRPLAEVKILFNLLKKFLLKERSRIIKNNIRFRVMGETSRLPEETQKLIFDLQNETKNADGLKLTFAFGYGARKEIVDAVNRFLLDNPSRLITEEDLTNNLYVSDVGDVDLLIRTGGDQRISNFLLWQVAYAELSFTDTKWPDFQTIEFRNIVEAVETRERRFGSVSATPGLKHAMNMAKENLKLISKTGRS